MKTRALLPFFVVCASITIVSAQPQSTVGKGVIRGMVAGDGLGRLEGIPITIEGLGTSYEVITDEDGEYQVSVPSGTYTIYPKFSPDDPRNGRFRRAKFLVLPNADTVIVLSPFAGFDYCSRTGERLVNLRPPGGSNVRKLPAANYESFEIERTDGPPLDLVIDFCKRENKGELIIYKSVSLTFNDMTLYADTVSLRPKDMLLQLVAGKATLIKAGVSQKVTRWSSSIGNNTFIELIDGFTESVKVKAKLHAHDISVSLDVERGGRGTVVYEDRERDIILVASGENLCLTSESPNKMKLSGYGAVSSQKVASSSQTNSYANFTITIDTKLSQLTPTLSIQIPSIKGYNASGFLPRGSVKIRRESSPSRLALAAQ